LDIHGSVEFIGNSSKEMINPQPGQVFGSNDSFEERKTDITPQNNPTLQSAQHIVESGVAPILGYDGKVVVQDIQQRGHFGQVITDDQGTFVEYFEPFEPHELDLTEGVPITGTAAMSAQVDRRRGEGIFVTKKVYMYPDREFANKYNSLDPEQREALIRSDEDFRSKTWNFSALGQYKQSGLTTQGQWEVSLGGFPVDVSTAREALEKVSKKSYEKIAQADGILQQIAPVEYQKLSKIEDKLIELESIDELAKDGSYFNTKKLELESEFRRLLKTPVEIEQGVALFGNLDACRQRLYAEKEILEIQESFDNVYIGSDECFIDSITLSTYQNANQQFESVLDSFGRIGHFSLFLIKKLRALFIN